MGSSIPSAFHPIPLLDDSQVPISPIHIEHLGCLPQSPTSAAFGLAVSCFGFFQGLDGGQRRQIFVVLQAKDELRALRRMKNKNREFGPRSKETLGP